MKMVTEGSTGNTWSAAGEGMGQDEFLCAGGLPPADQPAGDSDCDQDSKGFFSEGADQAVTLDARVSTSFRDAAIRPQR